MEVFVSLTDKVRTLAACLVLQCGAALGSPMKVEELEELLRALSTPKLAQTRPDEQHSGGSGPGDDGIVR